jgi:hypothetical protein
MNQNKKKGRAMFKEIIDYYKMGGDFSKTGIDESTQGWFQGLLDSYNYDGLVSENYHAQILDLHSKLFDRSPKE